MKYFSAKGCQWVL